MKPVINAHAQKKSKTLPNLRNGGFLFSSGWFKIHYFAKMII